MNNADFIAHAFATIQPDETPWVAGFPGDVAQAEHRVWFGAPAIPVPRFIRTDTNNYVCISTFHPDSEGRPRRRKDCWAGMWLVLLDDIGTKIDRAAALRLKPSCLVETSPGNFQGWLFLEQPIRDADKAEALINGLITAGASDPGAGNLTRYGRLPIGHNGKAKYRNKQGEEWGQRVHEWQPERRYTPEQIAQAYGFDLIPKPKRQSRKHSAPSADAGIYIDLLEWAGLYQGTTRGNTSAHRITCPWFEQHTGQDTTGTVYFEPDEANDMQGGFKCHHAACQGRHIEDFDRYMLGLLKLYREKARGA